MLVDLGGGASPFVVACRLRDELGAKLRVVAGLNTAMLVTALGHAQLDVDALAAHVARRGGDGIVVYPPLAAKGPRAFRLTGEFSTSPPPACVL